MVCTYLIVYLRSLGDAIPPDSTLVFEVELVHTTDGPVPPNVFKQIDKDEDQVLTHDEVIIFVVWFTC